MRGKSFRTKTLRLHPFENAIIDRACEVLNGMERTQLAQEAVLTEAGRLGVRWGDDPMPPLAKSWPYLPKRGGARTGPRVSITLSVSVAELVTRAARHVHASEPMFIIGATLAHIGKLQKLFRGIHIETAEEAAKIRAGLAGIELPVQYRHRARDEDQGQWRASTSGSHSVPTARPW